MSSWTIANVCSNSRLAAALTGAGVPERGTVAIAGHRTTYGAPFWDLDRVRRGDVVTLITEFGTFAYRVSRTEVIPPTRIGVLDPTKKPTLVLTTCTPRFSAAQRLIVFASLIPGRADAPA